MALCKSCGVGRVVRDVWCAECDPGPERDFANAVMASIISEARALDEVSPDGGMVHTYIEDGQVKTRIIPREKYQTPPEDE
jgi:hypothetical protein